MTAPLNLRSPRHATVSALVLPLVVLGCGSSATPPETQAHDPAPHPHREGSHAHHALHHDFSDAAHWTKRFDDPARDAWQKPDEVVKLLAIEPGMTVVDLGAGTGYFGKRLSAAAGPSGKLIALDPEPNMVSFMRDRFQKEALGNAEARTCPLDSTGLPDGSADRILIVDTWHHIEKRGEYTKHLANALRPGGWVMVVDFTLETDKGPPKQHRIAPDVVISELKAGGLDAAVVEAPLPDQYVVIGRKNAAPK
jgi:predicted methyltransferase